MASVFGYEPPQPDAGMLPFPQSLTEKYRPRQIDEFVGLDKPKRIMRKLAANPYASAWLFVGPSGTGKTTMGLALAEALPAELHHIPSQDCNLENIERVRRICQYVPMAGCKFHLVLVDEADRMTPAAQVSLLSKLDATNFPPNTIFIFTCNETGSLEPRFLSRCHVFQLWHVERRSGIAPKNLAVRNRNRSRFAAEFRPNCQRFWQQRARISHAAGN